MLIKRIAIGIGFSIFIIALLALGLKRASQNEWENWKAEWQVKGEKFDISSNTPNKVPDHQNFAKTQFFAPLFANDIETQKFNKARDRFKINKSISHDWRKGKKRDSISWENSFFESDLALIAEDLKRPYCRFDIQYQDGFKAQLPHLSIIKNIAYLFSTRAGEKLIKKEHDDDANFMDPMNEEIDKVINNILNDNMGKDSNSSNDNDIMDKDL